MIIFSCEWIRCVLIRNVNYNSILLCVVIIILFSASCAAAAAADGQTGEVKNQVQSSSSMLSPHEE